MQINRRKDFEQERYFSNLRMPFTKKFLVTAFDLLYVFVFNFPIFVVCAWYGASKNSGSGTNSFTDAFKCLIKNDENANQIEPWRLLVFSVWLFLFMFMYFVWIPSKTDYQTFFSVHLGMRAVTLKDTFNHKEKITVKQMFIENFVPVLMFPLLNILFFWVLTAFGCHGEWSKNLFSNASNASNASNEDKYKYIQTIFRTIYSVAAFIQMHHIFTVAASKKTINWFVKSNGIVWVDLEKVNLYMKSEDKPLPPSKDLITPNLNLPGVNETAYEALKQKDNELGNESIGMLEEFSVDPVK